MAQSPISPPTTGRGRIQRTEHQWLYAPTCYRHRKPNCLSALHRLSTQTVLPFCDASMPALVRVSRRHFSSSPGRGLMQIPSGAALHVGLMLTRLSLMVPPPSGRNTRMFEAFRLTTTISHGLPSAMTLESGSSARAGAPAKIARTSNGMKNRQEERSPGKRAVGITCSFA